jgi:signal transduction histidine kinase
VTHEPLDPVELARRKDELSAAIAHDLRSPLAAVKGAIDLLTNGAAGEVSEEQRRYLHIAERAARHILDLVNDLLESSLLDAGLTRLEALPFDLVPALGEAGATYELLAREKGISLGLSLPDALMVTADRERVGQIVSNLLANAVKFTDTGGRIVVSAAPARNDDGGGDGFIEVRIADTGVGIPPGRIPTLFDKFKRSRSRGTRGERGTGLGLYICRQLVELHGGKIGVDSTLGGGTTFRFTLPGGEQ